MRNAQWCTWAGACFLPVLWFGKHPAALLVFMFGQLAGAVLMYRAIKIHEAEIEAEIAAEKEARKQEMLAKLRE